MQKLVRKRSFEKAPQQPVKGTVLGHGRVSREGQDLGTAACALRTACSSDLLPAAAGRAPLGIPVADFAFSGVSKLAARGGAAVGLAAILSRARRGNMEVAGRGGAHLED